MIGTIRPNKEALKCLGLTQDVTNAMCRTCNASAHVFGSLARLGLSHDAIFLGLFSSSEQFTSAPLRRAPLRCMTSSAAIDCPDAHYLAGITLFTSATKIFDDHADGQISLRPWTQRKIRTMSNQAEERLRNLGLPVADVTAELGEYRKLEAHGRRISFSALSGPIARAYGMIFEHLPSRANQNTDRTALREIGRSYGELTLLVDAVEDANQDQKTGRFNAWRASRDIPSDAAGAKAEIARRFDSLLTAVSSQRRVAADYLRAAREATLERLSGGARWRERFLTHPSTILLAGINCCEEDCFGNVSLTPTGMCIAVLCCVGCIACCKRK